MNNRLFAFPILLFLLLPCSGFAQSCSSGGSAAGTAYVSSIINWSQSGDLYFTVTGAPPNVCGALATIRNGSCLYTPGWICTDGNGNSLRGPWRWIDQPGDQTDTNIHFDWPNGTSTYFTTNHYWDKTCPTPVITSSNGTPPASFSGTGSDGNWGAGFGSWTSVKLQFQDNTTGGYWNPLTSDYTALTPPDISGSVTSSVGSIGPGTSDSPSYQMTWDGSAAMPLDEQAGHSYTWTMILLDGDTQCHNSVPLTFRMPRCIPSINNPC